MDKGSLSPVSDHDDSVKRKRTPTADDETIQYMKHQRELEEKAELERLQQAAFFANPFVASQLAAVYGLSKHVLFPPAPSAIQTQPLSLKMERAHSDAAHSAANPLSGSSGTTNQASPSTSSTDPEPEDLSINVSPSDNTAGGRISQCSSAQQSWSFEEQFKQLYELSNEPERKDFLDELFSFMQKRATPVTRIPIMAKQNLDLYELYKLVTANGGLVEVINKKLWREITKGLNLPSSITSAAFTLRTQYMKYLYEFECEKLNLSTKAELQQAIDGNRREGRRAAFHPYSHQMPASMVPNRHVNGNGISLEDEILQAGTPLGHPALAAAAFREQQALVMEAAQRELERSAVHSTFRGLVEQTQQQSANAHRHSHAASGSGRASTSSVDSENGSNSPAPLNNAPQAAASLSASLSASAKAARQQHQQLLEDQEALQQQHQQHQQQMQQQQMHDFTRLLPIMPNLSAFPTANIKITNLAGTPDGRGATDSNYMIVNMDINGVVFQGFLMNPSLFAAANKFPPIVQ